MPKGPFFLTIVALLLGTNVQAAQVSYTAAGGRDPFAAPFVQKKSAEDPGAMETRLQSFTIQGVLASSKNPRAIINGKIYRVGNELASGIKITKISKEGVFVMIGGKETLINRAKPTTKGKSANENAKNTQTA